MASYTVPAGQRAAHDKALAASRANGRTYLYAEELNEALHNLERTKRNAERKGDR